MRLSGLHRFTRVPVACAWFWFRVEVQILSGTRKNTHLVENSHRAHNSKYVITGR